MSKILYKNIASLLISISSLILSHQQQYHSAGTLIALYVTTDLCFVESFDMALHHLLALGFIASVRHLEPTKYALEAKTIINVEISTIFLAINNLIKAKILVVPSLTKVNQYLFLLTFSKFRVWDFYWVLLNRISFPSTESMVTLGCLYLLNLYWFSLIIRKIMKFLHISDPTHNILKPAVSDPCFSGRNAS